MAVALILAVHGRSSVRTPAMPAPEAVLRLVERFDSNREAYLAAEYNETQTRLDFIDPFFKALGWDVYNDQGYAEPWREVIHEDAFRMGGVMNAPDYSFRLGGRRIFFLEAKKPSIDLSSDPAPAFQLRRYAWTAKLPLSILTNFAEFIVYDTRVRPASTDSPAKARVLYIRYDQYAERWDEIASIFSPQAIRRGALEKYVESATGIRGTAEVDDAFLAEIAEWRTLLAHNIALRNHGLTERQINYAVHATIDRIVFLRICEDRCIESYGRIQALLNGQNVYDRLRDLYRQADDRYNSGLFHFRHERGRTGTPDELTPRLTIDDSVLKDIFRRLYYPDCPYEFSVLPAEILGQVYERFLGSVITLTRGGRAKVEEKHEVRKAGGVYYTPAYIVDYIVRQTVGKLLEGKTPQEVAGVTEAWRPSRTLRPLAVLDPACGSGSFLIGAYQFLLDWHLDQYSKDTGKWSTGGHPRIYRNHRGTWHLTTAERKRILLANVFGVDIDPQAVEVTKLSLLLKVLEGENAETLQRQLALFHERALPDLAANIKCGNSLIGPDFYNGHQMSMFDEEEMHRVNVFNWNDEFPEIMRGGGFDAIIGNPPYVRIQRIGHDRSDYIFAHYSTPVSKTDLSLVFIEKAVGLMNADGTVGLICTAQWMRTEYGRKMRGFLGNGLIAGIVDFGSLPVFRKASTYPGVFIISKRRSDSVEYRRIASRMDLSLDGIEHSEAFTISSGRLGEAPWNPHGLDILEALGQKEIQVERLSHFGHAYIGTLTGMDSVFVMTVHEAERIGLERDLLLPYAYRGEEVSRYEETLPGAVVVYPYKRGRDGRPVIIPEAVLKKEYPITHAYLVSHKAKLRTRRDSRRLYANGPAWYRHLRPGSFNYILPRKLIVKGISRRTEVGVLGEGATFNGANCPGIILVNMGLLSERYFLALLNSKLSTAFFRGICPAKLSNYLRFNSTSINRFPVRLIDVSRAADQSRHDTIISLVRRMLDLRTRLTSATTAHERTLLERQIAATDRQIDHLVYELYELTDAEIAIVEEAAKAP